MRIIVKGGVWKNTEDEILKAAVMKYGKNQWARISSLLTRKTPKQCKARWYEWIDPSVKKTEWQKEEDEKLLHLAKLMPTQWRTIAPIVGRTPSQCLERYQNLLEEAEGIKEDGPSAEDVRRLRPGEIDPEPETKPARPDPVDMDEDEKEMLSEARARLANTQGKKAKRKAREKQLDEARRLAGLQKHRELKAAGIEYIDEKRRRKLFVMDYNTDIPFQRKAPIGFHDSAEELEREKREKERIIGKTLEELEGRRRNDVETDERKKDIKKQKHAKSHGRVPAPPQALRDSLEQADFVTSARKPLILPAPQVGDIEIETLVKIKSKEDEAKAIVDFDENDASVTNSLLGEYNSFAVPTTTASGGSTYVPRTPRTPADQGASDALKLQARNLRAMENSQTPLLGGTVDVEDEAYKYSTGPVQPIARLHTPNPLAAQLTPRAGDSIPGSTPRSESGRTPRDSMGINTPSRSGSESNFGDTPRQRQSIMKTQIESLFKSLPAPKNDFTVVIPDTPKVAESDNNKDILLDEDMEDVISRERKAKEESERQKMLLETSAVQKNLPRPLVYLPDIFEPDQSSNDNETCAMNLIKQEMERLILKDMAYNPTPHQTHIPKDLVKASEYDVTVADLTAAQELISKELVGIRMDIEEFTRNYDSINSQYMYFYPPPNSSIGHYEKVVNVSEDDLKSNQAAQLESCKSKLRRDQLQYQKMEKKLSTLVGGYMARVNTLNQEFHEVYQKYQDSLITLKSFEHLKEMEDRAMVDRTEELQKYVDILEAKETMLQEKYQNLVEAKNLKNNASLGR